MNEGFGKDFHRKGNSVKRSGPFAEPPDSENKKVAVLIPFSKISSYDRPSLTKEGDVALARGFRFGFWGLPGRSSDFWSVTPTLGL